ncbi:MAG: NUDIX hydrolase [Eubacterium ramulus]
MPGGMVEEGETPREAALRECAGEELLLMNKDQILLPWRCDKLYTGSRPIMCSFFAAGVSRISEYHSVRQGR